MLVRTRSGVLCLCHSWFQFQFLPITLDSSEVVFFFSFLLIQDISSWDMFSSQTDTLFLPFYIKKVSQSLTGGVGYFPLLIKPCVGFLFICGLELCSLGRRCLLFVLISVIISRKGFLINSNTTGSEKTQFNSCFKCTVVWVYLIVLVYL